MNTDDAFVVSYDDPAECLEKLEKVQFEFECLLDYMAMNHPKHLPADFIDGAIEHLNDTALKYDLVTSG
jgi:hypothetical protein